MKFTPFESFSRRKKSKYWNGKPAKVFRKNCSPEKCASVAWSIWRSTGPWTRQNPCPKARSTSGSGNVSIVCSSNTFWGTATTILRYNSPENPIWKIWQISVTKNNIFPITALKIHFTVPNGDLTSLNFFFILLTVFRRIYDITRSREVVGEPWNLEMPRLVPWQPLEAAQAQIEHGVQTADTGVRGADPQR